MRFEHKIYDNYYTLLGYIISSNLDRPVTQISQKYKQYKFATTTLVRTYIRGVKVKILNSDLGNIWQNASAYFCNRKSLYFAQLSNTCWISFELLLVGFRIQTFDMV